MVLFHLFGYSGHFGFDDMHYAYLANELKNGNFYLQDHFSYRLGTLLFTWLTYCLFGINDFASSLPSMTYSAICLYLVYQMLKKQSNLILCFGLLLTISSEWFLFYSDKLMPDFAVTFAFVGAFYAVYRQYFVNSNQKWNGLLLALFLFFGFNSKGTILLIAPWLVFILLMDIIQKRNKLFWISAILSGGILLGSYFLICELFFGNAFIRFEAISANSYLNRCSYGSQSYKILFERLTSGFWGMAYREGLLFPFLLFVPLLLKMKKSSFQFNRAKDYFIISAVILLLSSCFMSISLEAYNPMCLDIRHYLFVIPMAAIAASFALEHFFQNSQKGIAIYFLLLLIACYLIGNSAFELLYLGAFSVLTLTFFIQKKKSLSLWLFAAALLVQPLSMTLKGNATHYSELRSLIYEHLIDNKEVKYVITNPVQARVGNYYTGFKPKKTHFLSYHDFDPDTLNPNRKLYILKAWHSRSLSFLNESEFPFYVQLLDPDSAIVSSESPLMSIHQIDDLNIKPSSFKTFIHSMNDFESEHLHWNYPIDEINTDFGFESNHSNKVFEYSSTFQFDLEPLMSQPFKFVYTQLKFQIYVDEPTESIAVISFENKDGSVKWTGIPADKQIKSYSNWWPIEVELLFPKREIEAATTLKVYLWNKDKKHCFIDDFEVQVSTK